MLSIKSLKWLKKRLHENTMFNDNTIYDQKIDTLVFMDLVLFSRKSSHKTSFYMICTSKLNLPVEKTCYLLTLTFIVEPNAIYFLRCITVK